MHLNMIRKVHFVSVLKYICVFPLLYACKSAWLNVWGFCACVCLSRAQSKWGCPSGVSTYTVSKPIWACWQQEHDCPSLWPHAQCQLCSAGMETRKRDLRTDEQEEQEREPMERQRAEKRGCMLGWRMTRGSELTEYKWDRIEWWRSTGATAKWRCAFGWLLMINIQRVVLNRVIAE